MFITIVYNIIKMKFLKKSNDNFFKGFFDFVYYENASICMIGRFTSTFGANVL